MMGNQTLRHELPGAAIAAAIIILTAVVSAGATPSLAARDTVGPKPMPAHDISEGRLISLDDDGQRLDFPLKHTDVQVEIAGFLSRVHVTQQFENPYPDKIEAVYVFPLPNRAAVDDMTLTVGDRVVRGKIKRREEARAIYEAARAKGHVAGLLDQERPNIFTQSVANIMPGEHVTVKISYVETLRYEDGSYELAFPMVVGPRYIPGQPTGKLGGGWAYDTDQVPDASRITPLVTPPGTRAGHDISITVSLDAGLPVERLHSSTHAIKVEYSSKSKAFVRLENEGEIPNKDFILSYDVAGRKIEDAVLTYLDGNDGFFALILQPPDRVTAEDVTPKELVFVLDTSGSMSGFPIEKAKETMGLALKNLYPQDTFNLITFAGNTRILFPEPVPATRANLRKAQDFLKSRSGGGGTEMMKAIRTALESSDEQDHIRIVCFMTDGFVGNDLAIIDEVQKHPNARVFSFGIGSSVNRFLLDKMAGHGRGEVEYVGLDDDGSAAARRFHERVRNPLLTDLSVDWGGLPVEDVYPKRVPDLFSAKPLIITGRFTATSSGVVRLHGNLAGRPITRKVHVNLAASGSEHEVLATLWARTRIADLMSQDYRGIQNGNPRPEMREAITQLGLDYRLMTQFTSFVAVEEMTITEGGLPRRVDVPVEMPEGVSYEGVFGDGVVMHKRAQVGRMHHPAAAQRHAASKSMPLEARADELAESDAQDAPRMSVLTLKLSPVLASLAQRAEHKTVTLTEEEAKFVKGGKVEVQIWLKDTSHETMARLKKLGLELLLQPKTARLIIGRLPITRLAELANLEAVRYVTPQVFDS